MYQPTLFSSHEPFSDPFLLTTSTSTPTTTKSTVCCAYTEAYSYSYDRTPQKNKPAKPKRTAKPRPNYDPPRTTLPSPFLPLSCHDPLLQHFGRLASLGPFEVHIVETLLQVGQRELGEASGATEFSEDAAAPFGRTFYFNGRL